MVDPQRLLDQHGSEFERKLLSAGLGDAPSSSSRAHIVSSVSMGGFPSGGSGGPAAGGGSGLSGAAWLRSAARFALTRWGLSSVIGAVAIAGGVKLAKTERTAEAARPAPAALVSYTASAMAPAVPASHDEAVEPRVAAPTQPAGEADAVPAPRAAVKRRSPAPERSGLDEELRSLEAARASLASGNPRRTLSLLDEYSRTFRAPRLTSEATVLRIEALAASGERARAEQLGKEFLRFHANGPFGRRVRSLIGDTNSASK